MAKKNILLFRNDRFGEFLLIIPCIRAIKEAFPDAGITLVCNPYVKELAGFINEAGEVITWNNHKHSFFEILNFSRKLAVKKFDISIVFNPSQELNLINFLAGIPVRVGFDRKWPFLLNRKIPDRKYTGDRHEVEYNLELVSLIGATSRSFDSHIDIGPVPGNNTIVIHPWTSDNIKQWPLERFKELVLRIVNEIKKKVVIVGGRDELNKYGGLFRSPHSLITDMTGKTSLPELAKIIKGADLLISGDSGPMHLAASLGTKVIALFRNDIPSKAPRRWGPWTENKIVIEGGSLTDISVEEVFNTVRKVLAL
ncbi:MAG: glycosyltransferase family 9 protein [Candidatus Omnitrophota bacterium]|jgi:heptosyltransferase-2|nr:MAG: glycosyltransferase family 9 protein [Candidatus Omnitrophota bacterium]